MPSPADWYADHDEVVTFARALVDANVITTVDESLYYFEKPWKWTAEHDAWAQCGKPLDGLHGREERSHWHGFLDALDGLHDGQGHERYMAERHHDF